MKHVFQFFSKHPTATGSGAAYVGEDGRAWKGFRAELLASDGDGDSLYLEGDGESLKRALTGLLRVLEACEQRERDRFLKIVGPDHGNRMESKGNKKESRMGEIA